MLVGWQYDKNCITHLRESSNSCPEGEAEGMRIGEIRIKLSAYANFEYFRVAHPYEI
jgi:hypothetical protein